MAIISLCSYDSKYSFRIDYCFKNLLQSTILPDEEIPILQDEETPDSTG